MIKDAFLNWIGEALNQWLEEGASSTPEKMTVQFLEFPLFALESQDFSDEAKFFVLNFLNEFIMFERQSKLE